MTAPRRGRGWSPRSARGPGRAAVARSLSAAESALRFDIEPDAVGPPGAGAVTSGIRQVFFPPC
ncbi:hypothetical protein ACQP2P_14500 [Dactylosporangium sp. CA-139114]|uniref:hypothetical protein n=1 Tax=Dactylosporangium sp. CA-139114 TaxID=3239931 RepID=UPI003D986518